MNKLIYFVIILLLPFELIAQSNFPPCSAYDNIGKDTLRSVNSYSNSLYVGIDNPIEVVKKNITYKNISLVSSQGIVIKDDSYKFNIIPSKTGEILIYVYQHDNGDSVLVFSKVMNVLRVPQPYIAVERMKFNELQSVNKDFFKSNKLFEVHLSDDFIDDSQWFKIKEISVGHVSGMLYTSKSCAGSVLSDEILNMLSNVYSGKEVSFVFTITGTGDLFIRMQPVKIKIY
jgi:hypothetical protein